MSDTSSDPDRIERDLDRTRARLDNRLTELQDRFSPGQVLDDLMGYFRGSEGAEFGRNLLDSVRQNPLPAAITGIGLAWLMASNPHPRADEGTGLSTSPSRGRVRVSGYGGPEPLTYGDMTARMRSAEQGVMREQGEAEDTYRARLDEVRGRAIGLARDAEETAASFGQRIQDALTSAQQAVVEGARDLGGQISDAAHSATQSVSDAAQGAAQRASSTLSRGGHAAGRASSDLMATLTDSPVLLGALGLAAGALLGALVPQSDQEEAALGGIAGQARDTARDLAREAVDRGGQVAQTVLDKGRQSASEHGLTGERSVGTLVDAALSGDLAGDVKQVAQDVLRAGDDAVREQGLGQPGQDGQPPAPRT